MKKNKKKQQEDLKKKLDYIATVNRIDRELAIENKTFHSWNIPSKVHKDKKKHNDKTSSRKYKYKGDKD